MITDICFFIFYSIERFGIQKFNLNYIPSFILNILISSFGIFLILLICEIIDLDCFDFNKYIRKSIKKRQLSELLNSEIN